MDTSYALDRELIVLLLDQVNVSVCNTMPAVAVLRTFALDPVRVRKYGSCVSLVFEGYESQKDELYQNPFVRAFIVRLTEQFPYWLHYLRKDDDSLYVLMMCLLGPEGMKVTDSIGAKVTVEIISQKFNEVLMDLFGHMNALYADYGLTQAENSDMTQQVKRWVDRILRS